VTTCARLDLSGITEHLLPLLHETPLLDSGLADVQVTVLDAFRALPDMPEAAWEEVKRCMQTDPSKGVRAAAARALGTSSEDSSALACGIGDLPEVSHAAASVLPKCTERLSHSSFRDLVDRWLLQVIGTRQGQGSQGPSSDSSVLDTLLEDVLYRRLLEENQIHPENFSSADAISPEDLSASSEWFRMASWGLSI